MTTKVVSCVLGLYGDNGIMPVRLVLRKGWFPI